MAFRLGFADVLFKRHSGVAFAIVFFSIWSHILPVKLYVRSGYDIRPVGVEIRANAWNETFARLKTERFETLSSITEQLFENVNLTERNEEVRSKDKSTTDGRAPITAVDFGRRFSSFDRRFFYVRYVPRETSFQIGSKCVCA